jgi:hypothetical protein
MPARGWKKIGKDTRAIARRSADNDGKFFEGDNDKGFCRRAKQSVLHLLTR